MSDFRGFCKLKGFWSGFSRLKDFGGVTMGVRRLKVLGGSGGKGLRVQALGVFGSHQVLDFLSPPSRHPVHGHQELGVERHKQQ